MTDGKSPFRLDHTSPEYVREQAIKASDTKLHVFVSQAQRMNDGWSLRLLTPEMLNHLVFDTQDAANTWRQDVIHVCGTYGHGVDNVVLFDAILSTIMIVGRFSVPVIEDLLDVVGSQKA